MTQNPLSKPLYLTILHTLHVCSFIVHFLFCSSHRILIQWAMGSRPVQIKFTGPIDEVEPISNRHQESS